MASQRSDVPCHFSTQKALELYFELLSDDETDVLVAQEPDEEDYAPSVSDSSDIVHNLSETTTGGVDMEQLSDEEGEAAEDTEENSVEDESASAELEEISGACEGDYHNEWCTNLQEYPSPLTFEATPGLQGPLKLPPYEECKPVDFFKLFIDKNMLKYMKKETNKYARKIIQDARDSGAAISPRSYIAVWKPVTIKEISHFLAILIHMGIVRKPRIVDYWSTNVVLNTPFASKVMKRERFRLILSFFHLNDNSTLVPRGQPNYDPLHKIRPLVDHLNHVFQTVYIPQQQIAIDEALCPWRGWVSFRVYMKDKPVKWGMKLYELCESQSGYVCRFEVMCHQPGLSNKPYDVVHRLMQPYMSLGYCLYVDNYYCCPALAHSLSSSNTGLVGTVRPNRVGLPKDLMARKLNRGEAAYKRMNNVMAVKWMDKKEVVILTTIHKPVIVNTRSRTESKKKPLAIADYNKHMGGVDLSDQMMAYMPLHRRTLKWWKKLAFHLFTLTLVQAHCLYQKVRKQNGKPGLKLEDFFYQCAQIW